MDQNDEQWLLSLLTRQRDTEDRYRAEMMGEQAFDFLRRCLESGGLANKAVASALRLMSYISRIKCTHRKPVLLDLARRFLSSPDLELRGVAALIALGTFEALYELNMGEEASRRRAGLVAEVRASASMGLGPYQEIAERFLARDGEVRVEVSEGLPTDEV
jgi:hypothetical protein